MSEDAPPRPCWLWCCVNLRTGERKEEPKIIQDELAVLRACNVLNISADVYGLVYYVKEIK